MKTYTINLVSALSPVFQNVTGPLRTSGSFLMNPFGIFMAFLAQSGIFARYLPRSHKKQLIKKKISLPNRNIQRKARKSTLNK